MLASVAVIPDHVAQKLEHLFFKDNNDTNILTVKLSLHFIQKYYPVAGYSRSVAKVRSEKSLLVTRIFAHIKVTILEMNLLLDFFPISNLFSGILNEHCAYKSARDFSYLNEPNLL